MYFDYIANVAREQLATLILEKIEGLNVKNLPVVLTGDFNLTEDTKPLEIISQKMLNTYHHSAKKPYDQ